MGMVCGNAARVRYDRDTLLALREHASNSSAWNDFLLSSNSVVHELFQLDEEKAIPFVRKRNVDRRCRGAEKDSSRSSGVVLFDAKQKTHDLEYDPVVPESEVVEVDDVYADSDSENESSQTPAFLVYGEPNFEDGPPQDGMEYLRRVRWEAARCPKVKVSKINPKKFSAVQTIYIPQIAAAPACASELLPSRAWETEFLADFSDLRLRLAGMVVPHERHSLLPPVQNKAAWQVFCFGTREPAQFSDDEDQCVQEKVSPVEGDAHSCDEVSVDDYNGSVELATMKLKAASLLDCEIEPEETGAGSELHVAETDFGFKEENMEASLELHFQNGEGIPNGVHDHTSNGDVKVSARDNANGVNQAFRAQTPKERKPVLLPYAAVLLSLDEVSRAALLRNHVLWLGNVKGLPERQACWLFALAAVVDKPLDADTSASFRDLYRRCAVLRAAKSSCDDELVRLNMLITVSGRYFGQGDFAR